jgi:dienelactone hydrolase
MTTNVRRRWQHIVAFVSSAAFVVVSLVFAGPARAETVGVRWQPMLLPVTIDGHAYALDAMLVYPDDGKRHPLAIFSHGSPRAAADRPALTPAADPDELLWFVRRGFTVAAVLRRGYGRSDGGWAETYGSCADPDYADAGLRGAADVAATIRALGNDPHVDASRVLAFGVSAGAFATVALTTAPPPGLVAAVAFAPGRGSSAPDVVCRPERLVAAFARYGAASRIPLLWISASNDHFFGPDLVKRSLSAFDGAGGRATFFAAPADGDEGHYLFASPHGIAIWGPAVDRFLGNHHLAFVPEPLELEGPVTIVPAGLGPRGRAAFARYALAPPHKAFAKTSDGHYAYAFGLRSDADATSKAMATCERTQPSCAIVDVNGSPIK